MCVVYMVIYMAFYVSSVYIYIYIYILYIYNCLAIKCSLHLFCIAPIYVDVIVLVTNVFVVLSYRL